MSQSAVKYELLRVVNRGGMGEIALGRVKGTKGFEKLVVLKRLRADAEREDHRQMFDVEAELMSRIEHPNIVQVFDQPTIDETPYLAMAYVRGRNLDQVIRKVFSTGQPLPHAFAYTVMAETLRGLAFIHRLKDSSGKALGVVHQDITPSNILVSFFGEVKITDFGIAYVTSRDGGLRKGVLKGKPRYVAPEVLAGRRVNNRVDIYGAGVVFYEMLKGRALFARPKVQDTLSAVAKNELPDFESDLPDVDPGIHELLRRALAKDPGDRFRTAEEMGSALAAELAKVGGPQSPARMGYLLREWFKGDQDTPEHDGDVPDGNNLAYFTPAAYQAPDLEQTLSQLDRLLGADASSDLFALPPEIENELAEIGDMDPFEALTPIPDLALLGADSEALLLGEALGLSSPGAPAAELGGPTPVPEPAHGPAGALAPPTIPPGPQAWAGRAPSSAGFVPPSADVWGSASNPALVPPPRDSWSSGGIGPPGEPWGTRPVTGAHAAPGPAENWSTRPVTGAHAAPGGAEAWSARPVTGAHPVDASDAWAPRVGGSPPPAGAAGAMPSEDPPAWRTASTSSAGEYSYSAPNRGAPRGRREASPRTERPGPAPRAGRTERTGPRLVEPSGGTPDLPGAQGSHASHATYTAPGATARTGRPGSGGGGRARSGIGPAEPPGSAASGRPIPITAAATPVPVAAPIAAPFTPGLAGGSAAGAPAPVDAPMGVAAPEPSGDLATAPEPAPGPEPELTTEPLPEPESTPEAASPDAGLPSGPTAAAEPQAEGAEPPSAPTEAARAGGLIGDPQLDIQVRAQYFLLGLVTGVIVGGILAAMLVLELVT